MRIAICHAQVPLAYGGAEAQVDTLRHALEERGHAVAVVQIPYAYHPRSRLLRTCIAWRMLDLSHASSTPFDLVIAMKFPSYLVKHPNKSVWVIHQYRQAYDLAGTPYSDFQGRPRDRIWQWLIRQADNRSLTEARRVYTTSRNNADRLRRYNGISVSNIYPPPPLAGRYHHREYGDYIFTAGRLESLKRLDLLIDGMARAGRGARCLIAGAGPARQELEGRIQSQGLGDRVTLLGRVSDEALIELYAGARAAYYGPLDEDYGYVTVEAMASSKPVITLRDAGGPLEFVRPGITGWVVSPEPGAIGAAIDEACTGADVCERLGRAARELVAPITWDTVIAALVRE